MMTFTTSPRAELSSSMDLLPVDNGTGNCLGALDNYLIQIIVLGALRAAALGDIKSYIEARP